MAHLDHQAATLSNHRGGVASKPLDAPDIRQYLVFQLGGEGHGMRHIEARGTAG